MANRKQRRDTKKIMQRPELKSYVDKMCKDISEMLVDYCEEASTNSKENGTEFRIENVEDKLKQVMMSKGEELAKKIKNVSSSTVMNNQYQKSQLKVNIR